MNSFGSPNSLMIPSPEPQTIDSHYKTNFKHTLSTYYLNSFLLKTFIMICMKRHILLSFCFVLGMYLTVGAQSVSKQLENVEISSSTVKYLGKSKPILDLVEKTTTPKEKKDASRRLKKVPDNFVGRKPGGKAVHADLEHQGPDPIRQKDFDSVSQLTEITPLVNIDGLAVGGSPHDPTGDVNDEYYVQAINATTVGVYDLDGNLVQSFAMNTLWAEFNASSEGDPIILYDETVEKWVVTEFTDPANVLIAISDTKDPLGSYNAYSFSTPQFPDYPKYAITPTALVITTNEGGAGTLHQYFIDIEALYASEDNVTMIRVGVTGNTGTEAGFYVTTPADWNGTTLPYDNRPITLAINDSSWPGGPAQDQIEIYSFNLDFDTPANTTVDQTAVITTPFDSYPCSVTGFGFQCVPQLGGDGLDAIPEVIMNVPHLRNFGSHESLVLNFVTDVTDGNNQSGIRWVELRRTAGTEWTLYQEGTLGLDDGLDRYMGSIAMDGNGNIGLAYNISSASTDVGIRFTGRYASDPLGQMTVDEYNVIDGSSGINSFGRFGDYSQLSVSPLGDNTFWFTTEYATDNDAGTRIVAFQLSRDTFDLTVRSIIEPTSSDLLGASELVTAEIVNAGINPMSNYEVGLIVDNAVVQTAMISGTLLSGEAMNYQFTTGVDLSAVGTYDIEVYVNHPDDENPLNDTLGVAVSKLNAIDGGLEGEAQNLGCDNSFITTLTLENFGGQVITTAAIEVVVNGTPVDTIDYVGSISYTQADQIIYMISNNLDEGDNAIEFNIISINGSADNILGNNKVNLNYTLLAADQFVTLVFTTDNFPTESVWTITNTNTGDVLGTGTFTQGQNNSTINTRICLPLDSCYTLTVTDSYGDGICCYGGNGNFSVEDNQGNVLLTNNGEFGSLAVEEFCPSEACVLSATIVTENASGANVADGSIMITAANGMGPFQYSIDGGMTFQDSPLFENLLSGDYNVLVASADTTCSYAETVTVNFTTGIHIVNGQDVEIKLLPNPTQGVFKVIISNLKSNEPLLDFEIFDINGKLIQLRTIGKYNDDYTGTFSLYDYPSGNYFLRIINKEVSILERIIKVD